MSMSPLFRSRIPVLISSIIWAAIDALIHQAILSLLLLFPAEILGLELRVFMTGVVVVSCSFNGLYRISTAKSPAWKAMTKSALMACSLSIMFAFTYTETVPLWAVIIALIMFVGVSIFIRYSVSHVLIEGMPEFFRLFGAKAAWAEEGPSGEIDTSLRKDYRYNMKAVLAKRNKLYLFVKRLFDIMSSGLALLVLSPVLLLTAIAIKLEDGGPVIYAADRWGKDMKNFRMYKFRSMSVNAEAMIDELLKDSEMTGHAFKIKNDPRVTRVGHFIRKYSIDELPQLWNIFVGDMSVVGPRAIMTVGTDTIDDYDKQRWLVRPGLTCYWQVSGRANIKWEQWVEMDLDYIENMCLWEDFKLILKTFPVVFKADGAY